MGSYEIIEVLQDYVHTSFLELEKDSCGLWR